MAINKIKVGSTEHELQTTVANITDLTATATELNYMDGVTSNVQTQLDSKMDKENPECEGAFFMNTWSSWEGSSNFPMPGYYSSTLGHQNAALGDYSHAEGRGLIALGECSHAEGGSEEGNCPQYLPVMLASTGTDEKDYYFSFETNVSNEELNSYMLGNTYIVCTSYFEESYTVEYTATRIVALNMDDGILTLETSIGTDFVGLARFAYGGLAVGDCSHREGLSATAGGLASHAEGKRTLAAGEASHAEGYEAIAIGNYSHAEGRMTMAYSEAQHVQGRYNIEDRDGTYAHIVGNGVELYADSNGEVMGQSNAHTLDWDGNAWFAGDVYVGSTSGTNRDDGSEKLVTESDISTKMDKENPTGTGAVSINRHEDIEMYPIGDHSVAMGNSSIAIGESAVAMGELCAAADHSVSMGYQCSAGDSYAVTMGCDNTVNFPYSVAFGESNLVNAKWSGAIGADNNIKVGGNHSFVTGSNNAVSGSGSCAIGFGNAANASCSITLGSGCTAEYYSLAQGLNTTATGNRSVAFNNGTTASGNNSAAFGNTTVALKTQLACGVANNTSTATEGVTSGTGSGTAFVVGNGTINYNNDGTTTINVGSNAFRVDYNGVAYGKSAYTTLGCDYAEYFEWQDSNPDNEDRRGYFVTLDGEKIKIAEPGDYILGIISGHPAVIGNGDEDWIGRYILDDFGEYIYEDYEYEVEELEEVVDEETGEVTTQSKLVKHTGKTYKMNPDYDPTITYTQRADRPEWDAVGMIGVLSIRDDGTCQVNGYCQVAEGGTATAAESGYRVIKRVNDHIVKVIFR